MLWMRAAMRPCCNGWGDQAVQAEAPVGVCEILSHAMLRRRSYLSWARARASRTWRSWLMRSGPSATRMRVAQSLLQPQWCLFRRCPPAQREQGGGGRGGRHRAAAGDAHDAAGGLLLTH